MILRYHSINSKFKYPFTISKGTKTHQPALIVELEHLGHIGYGEAPAIPYYNITVDKMVEDIIAKKLFIEKFALTDPERYWHYLHHLLPSNPFLVCALDMAGWDLFGKIRGRQCKQLWDANNGEMPLTDYTIGIDSIDKMIAKMEALPWPVYKIKLGTDEDIKIIESLRKYTSSIFRVDANAAWKADEALEKIKAFEGMGVELIEQPLHKDDWEGMQYLYKNSPIPLFADESCVKEEDVEKCYGHFHGVNIKLTKCSGITPAKRMIKSAHDLGMKVMIGTMNETSIGSAAIAQLGPQVDYLDMDGPLLLQDDPATSVSFNYGRIGLGDAPGLGITSVRL